MVGTIIYEELRGVLDNGQRVLVQLFRNDQSGQLEIATLSLRKLSNDGWSEPTELTLD